MVADLSLAQRQFRNTLQPPLGGPWLQPKAQGALIAFLLLSHLSKPNPLLSADLQTGSPPQNPGHQTNTDQHLHLLPSGSSPGSCQHRNPSPTLSTMRLHLTHSAPTDLKRQGLESTGTQTTSSTSLWTARQSTAPSKPWASPVHAQGQRPSLFPVMGFRHNSQANPDADVPQWEADEK